MLTVYTRYDIQVATVRDARTGDEREVVTKADAIGTMRIDSGYVQSIVTTEIGSYSQCKLTFKDGSSIQFFTETHELEGKE